MDYARFYPIIALRTRGRIGKWWIHKDYKTYKVVTKYWYSEQPRTGKQQGWRSVFYDAVYNWKGFDTATKDFYNQLKRPTHMSGYNRYLRLYLEANYPMIIYWDSLEKNAGDPALIPDYIASPYFVRGFDISPISWDGWLEAKETWTRTGDFTFTISGNVTAKYPKGTRIRYKQGGSYEYGTVISASYSAPNTTITLATNDDYAMAAGAITDNYYSYIETPQGFPQWFTYSPTFIGFSVAPSGHDCQFSMVGKIVHFQFQGGMDGTSNSTDFQMSLPILASSLNPQTYTYTLVKDNGVFGDGIVNTQVAASGYLKFRKTGLAAFTASGAKNAWFSIAYRV